MIATTITLAYIFKKRITTVSWALIAAIGLISIVSVVRSSSLLHFLNVSSSMGLLLLLGYNVSGVSIRNYTINDYLASPVIASLGVLVGFIKFWQQAFRVKRKPAAKKESNPAIARGFLLATPLLMLFTALFASADEQFANFFNFDIDIAISQSLASWLFFVGMLLTIFIGIFTYFALLAKPFNQSSLDIKVGATEGLVVMGSVLVLFAGFALLQLSNTILAGPTLEPVAELAQNARQSFGQLVFASAVLFMVLLGIEKTNYEAKQRMYFLWLSGALIVSTFVILTSAIVRLIDYERVFGFTLTRFVVHAFIILLGLWFVLLFIKMLKKLKDSDLAAALSISAIAFVAVLNIINPDAIITRQNLANDSGVEIDYNYINSLSTDSIVGLSISEINDNAPIKDQLCDTRETLVFDSILDWSFSENTARVVASEVCSN